MVVSVNGDFHKMTRSNKCILRMLQDVATLTKENVYFDIVIYPHTFSLFLFLNSPSHLHHPNTTLLPTSFDLKTQYIMQWCIDILHV